MDYSELSDTDLEAVVGGKTALAITSTVIGAANLWMRVRDEKRQP